uniref:Phage terminase, small subunit n=1 Tax=Desulfovibrio sp. U5L TaxID=596152 RepID=I2PXJ5_9BACT
MADSTQPGRLTDRQRRFVEEYLVDLNPGAAAIRAGYGEKSAGAVGRRLRNLPPVRAAVEAAMARRGQRLRITQDRVVAELARIAFADIRDFVAWDEAGVTLRASRELGPEQTACVAEIVESAGKTGKGLRIKLHGKTQALAALSRHLGPAGREGHPGPAGPEGHPGPVGPEGKGAPANGPRPIVVVTCVPEPDPPLDEDSSGDGPAP